MTQTRSHLKNEHLFVAVFLGCTSTGRVGLCFLLFLCPGTPEGSTGSGSGFKASQKTGQRLKVSSDRLGEAGNRRTCIVGPIRDVYQPFACFLSSTHFNFNAFKKSSKNLIP